LIEYRWANYQYDRLPTLAADLVSHRVAVIAAAPPVAAAFAAKAATQTIPIVFMTAADPVLTGLVSSLNRPDGNITGVTIIDSTLGPKSLELLHELIPQASTIAVFFNPDNPSGYKLTDIEKAAQVFDQQLAIFAVKRERDIDADFDALVQQRVGALLVAPDSFLFSQRERLIARAAIHALPVISDLREFPVAGGLASYGASISDAFRQGGVYAGKILKGTKTTDLPVLQPTKFELVINLKTAPALGLEVPPTLLARADEVIE
jgi:putative ABC transport system substrate-binding protein